MSIPEGSLYFRSRSHRDGEEVRELTVPEFGSTIDQGDPIKGTEILIGWIKGTEILIGRIEGTEILIGRIEGTEILIGLIKGTEILIGRIEGTEMSKQRL